MRQAPIGLMIGLSLLMGAMATWNFELERRVQQLQANQQTQVAAYNDLARIVRELEERLGIPPANRAPGTEQ